MTQMTLGLHFSDRTGGIIVVRTATACIERYFEMTRASSENLPLAVGALLEEAATSVSSLNGIGVVTGPGALTSLRLSVATAQTLGLVATVPVVGINTFETMLVWGWHTAQVAVIEGRPGRCLVRGYVQQGDGFGPIFNQIEQNIDQTIQLINRFNCRVGVVVGADWIADRLQKDCPRADIRGASGTGAHLVRLINRKLSTQVSPAAVRISYGYAPV